MFTNRILNSFLTFFAIVLIGIIIAGVYGILHDQLTYTISEEYYTKFKFYQFGLCHTGTEAILPHPRLSVAVVGFLATWWMGVPVSIILGLVGLIHKDAKTMFRITLHAFALTIFIAFLTGLVGLIYGWFYLSKQPITSFEEWFIPNNLKDFRKFISVGSMHNFSYLGGLTGLIAGVIYSIRHR
jgi:hypothetical protein